MKPEFEAYVERGFSHFKLALKDYNAAIALNYQYPGQVYYYRAMLYLQEKNSAKAIQDLSKAVRTDPYYKRQAQTDPHFDSLRKNPEFIKMVEE